MVAVFQCNHFVCINCIPGIIFLGPFVKHCPLCRSRIHLIFLMNATDYVKNNFIYRMYNRRNLQSAHKNPIPDCLIEVLDLPNSPLINSIKSGVFIHRKDSMKNTYSRLITKALCKCPVCDVIKTEFSALMKHIL